MTTMNNANNNNNDDSEFILNDEILEQNKANSLYNQVDSPLTIKFWLKKTIQQDQWVAKHALSLRELYD